MGIFQLDMTVKTAIELGLQDMLDNPWLIDHLLEDAIQNPYLKDKYGQKQIDACKEWFKNNKINIYMRPRNDKDQFPCVCITLGPSPEKEAMKSMADQSTESVMLLPQKIDKPIPFVMKPFVPTNYSMEMGTVGVPEDAKGLENVAEGMILVDPDKGQGFVIKEITDEGFVIDPGIELDATRLAVVPAHQYYVARLEHSFFQSTCDISCYAHGDPQNTLWLHSIVLYSILRYRESLLESQGFSESSVASSALQDNPNYSGPNGEQSFVMSISLTGQVENTWIKSPRRVIEKVVLREKKGSGFTGGIKILSNSEPEIVNEEDVNWFAINGNEDDKS